MEDGHLIAVGTPQRVSSSSDRFFFLFKKYISLSFPSLSLSLSFRSSLPYFHTFYVVSICVLFDSFFFTVFSPSETGFIR